MLTALGGRAWCTGRVSFPRLRCGILWWVASSYLHLILVCSCGTLPPYFQAWVSPVGTSAFVAPGYPPLFLSSSFFLGVGGRACFFCSSVSIRSFIAYSIVFFFCSTVSYSFFLCISYRILLLLFRVLFVLPTIAYLFCYPIFLSYPFFLA